MRHFDDEYCVILGARISESDLTVRFDTKESSFHESLENGVLETQLEGCSDLDAGYDFFAANQGEYVWNFDFNTEESVYVVLLDNGAEIKVPCNRYRENFTNFTRDELDLKMRWLAERYKREIENSTRGWRKYSTLNQIMDREVKKELNNLEHKKKFFEDNPERTNTLDHSIKFCERLLNYLSQVTLESK